MKIAIIVEVETTTGEYQVTFRNKSEPGGVMDLNVVKKSFLKVAESFAGGKSEPIRN